MLDLLLKEAWNPEVAALGIIMCFRRRFGKAGIRDEFPEQKKNKVTSILLVQ